MLFVRPFQPTQTHTQTHTNWLSFPLQRVLLPLSGLQKDHFRCYLSSIHMLWKHDTIHSRCVFSICPADLYPQIAKVPDHPPSVVLHPAFSQTYSQTLNSSGRMKPPSVGSRSLLTCLLFQTSDSLVLKSSNVASKHPRTTHIIWLQVPFELNINK